MNAADTPLHTAATLPAQPRECVALVRPNSPLHSRLYRDFHDLGHKPVWGIYECDPAFRPSHELRFGDGSWLELQDDELNDVVLLTHMNNDALAELFP